MSTIKTRHHHFEIKLRFYRIILSVRFSIRRQRVSEMGRRRFNNKSP